MRAGISIVQMAQELERQVEAKRDFTAPTKSLVMLPDAKTIRVGTAAEGVVTRHAEQQLATKLDIPAAFYTRLRDRHPDLLAHNVNTLFQREPANVMVRTLDNKVRAFVSDKYRPLDNYDFFEAIAPLLTESGAVIESAELTETRMYIKARAPWLDRKLPVPEGLKMGEGHNFFVRSVEGAVTASNSEVGYGALAVNPGIWERACTNLAVFKAEGFGRMHIGKAKGGDDVQQYLSDDTRRLSDAVIWAQVRDVMKATLDGRVIDNIIAQMNAARGDVIESPTDVVEVFATKKRLSDGEKGGLLKYLTQSGEMTRYGLQWAVTRLAGDAQLVPDYDRASDLERLGGEVIELPRSDWKEMVRLAA